MALFFNQRKPRGFNYTPRYYDPEAEAREERKKIVLGEKYKSPAERRAREAAAVNDETGSVGADGAASAGAGSAGGATNADYVPGTYLREHVAARRGNAHAAEAMRRHRRKQRSVYVLLGMLALIVLIVWYLYFR